MAATPTLAYINAANTARDGSGTPGTDIFVGRTGTTNGTKIEQIFITHVGSAAPTAGMIRIFLRDNSASQVAMIYEVEVPATAPSATVQNWKTSLRLPNLFLANLDTLEFTSHFGAASDLFEVVVMGTDY